MLRSVTVGETVDDWTENPSKLIAFLIEQLWRAGIKPDDAFSYRATDGVVEILNGDNFKNIPLQSNLKLVLEEYGIDFDSAPEINNQVLIEALRKLLLKMRRTKNEKHNTR